MKTVQLKIKDDIYYLNRIKLGDKQAFGFLVEKYKDIAFTLALRIMRNELDAEEVAQDAFVSAFHSIQKFEGKSKFSTWLYSIVYNTAISKLRKDKKHQLLSFEDEIYTDDLQDEQELDFDGLEQIRKTELIKNAIRTLNELEQTIITLFYYEETGVSDIAEIVGITEANVKVKLFRARKKMYMFLCNYQEQIFNTAI